ncbi:MAG: SIMPL domain-containing protein [Alistipes sp.]|nr:SIMPL domain-containing protein [Alistipes sp.]
MKKLLLVVAMAFAALSLSVGGAQAQELANATPYVAVNGSSQVKVTPDEIYLRITLDEGDTKGKDVIEAQRKRLFSALRRCGVDIEKQLTLLDMSSENFRRGSSLATTQYELKLTSAEAVREVFEALDKDGITNVSVTRTASSKIDDYRRQARQQAIRNAQSRARDLAEAIGQSIGACFEINDYTSEARVTNSRVMMAKSAAVDMAAEEVEPNVEFEQIVINYNVSAKFVLNTK